MTRHIHLILGVAMGPMMLLALHGGDLRSLVGFVLLHVMAAGALLALAALGARHTRWGRRVLTHRPSLRHVGLMAAAMAVSAGAAHLVHAAMGHGALM